MSFRTALDALGGLSVSGVTHFDISQVPATVERAALPALLVLPGEADHNRIFKERGSGFEAVAFGGGVRTLSITVTHLLLVAPITSGTGLQQHLPATVDLVDAYIAALGADVTLGDALATPARVTVETGEFRYGTVTYHGCAFRHRWTLEVTP